jgi:hypothetical protein
MRHSKFRDKRRSCGLCKPHKRRLEHMFDDKERAKIKQAEEEIAERKKDRE